jgi:hypothetical protein
MLNWDDYGKEEANTAAAVAATKPVIETPQVAEQQLNPATVRYCSSNKKREYKY